MARRGMMACGRGAAGCEAGSARRRDGGRGKQERARRATAKRAGRI
jgi:hypothetical protein